MKFNQRLRIISLCLIMIFSVFGAVQAKDDVDIYAILKKIDTNTNFGEYDFSSVMTMVVEDPEKGIEKMVVHQFRRDREEKFLLLIQEPSVQKGQGYLLEGDNLWFYDPSSRQFAHNSLKESFQGSDVRNSDFTQWTYSSNYEVAGYEEGSLGGHKVYIVELEATSNSVTYPYIKLWITQTETPLVLMAEEYSLTKRLMRTSLFPKYATIGSFIIPQQMIFVDELVKGSKTQVILSELSISPIPDNVFTKAYIERVNR